MMMIIVIIEGDVPAGPIQSIDRSLASVHCLHNNNNSDDNNDNIGDVPDDVRSIDRSLASVNCPPR